MEIFFQNNGLRCRCLGLNFCKGAAQMINIPCFKAFLVTFNFFVRMYAGVREKMEFNAFSTTSTLEVSPVQNSSNLKDLGIHLNLECPIKLENDQRIFWEGF